MLRSVYTFLALCVLPMALLRLLWRSLSEPEYRRRWSERFGVLAQSPGPSPVWLHAASVGEVMACAGLVEEILLQEQSVLVTTATPAGAAVVTRLFGTRVTHAYVPFDLPVWVRRFVRLAQPSCLLLIEKELWPNLIVETSRHCPVWLLNARMSESSARSYRRAGLLFKPVFECLAGVAAQSTDDQSRLHGAGIPEGITFVTGNLKQDLRVSDDQRTAASGRRLQLGLSGQPVLVAASTHPADEAVILQAMLALSERRSDVVLIWAPRHPSRVPVVASTCEAQGLRVQRFGDTSDQVTGANVLLLEQIGALRACYGLADLALIGGTWGQQGGHNPFEAAVWGLPILSGPSWHNFAIAADSLQTVGALHCVLQADALVAAVETLLGDVAQRKQRGEAGRHWVNTQPSALAQTLDLLAGVG